MKRILVIGSSNIDCVITSEILPVPGETVLGRYVEKHPGGKGANQAVACGLLGGNTVFLSALGCDGDEQLLLDMFEVAGIDCSGIRRVAQVPTGTAYINVDRNGHNSIVVIAGANSYCDRQYLQSCDRYFKDADIVLIQMEIPHEAIDYILSRTNELGKLVILNPAPAPEQFESSWYAKVDYLTPNETELHKISGLPVNSLAEIEVAARKLLDQGTEHIIVTLGGKGAMLVQKGVTQLFSPPDIKVVDTTAAGDTFNAAIAVALSEGRTIEDAIQFANYASTISVSRKGAQPSIPTRKEVDGFQFGGIL